MKSREAGNRKVGMAGKAGAIACITVVFLCMMLPLYQVGENHKYMAMLAEAGSGVVRLEETERTLRSEISMARNPESLIDNVVERSLEYSEIDGSSVVRIARSGA